MLRLLAPHGLLTKQAEVDCDWKFGMAQTSVQISSVKIPLHPGSSHQPHSPCAQNTQTGRFAPVVDQVYVPVTECSCISHYAGHVTYSVRTAAARPSMFKNGVPQLCRNPQLQRRSFDLHVGPSDSARPVSSNIAGVLVAYAYWR